MKIIIHLSGIQYQRCLLNRSTDKDNFVQMLQRVAGAFGSQPGVCHQPAAACSIARATSASSAAVGDVHQEIRNLLPVGPCSDVHVLAAWLSKAAWAVTETISALRPCE